MPSESAPQRFPILYTGGNKSLALMGMTQRSSHVELSDDTMTVRMGIGFRSSVPRASIAWAEQDDGPVGGWGVHGWRGRWLVNGSAKNLVRIKVDPPNRGFVMGYPVKVQQLRISMEDPAAFLAALEVDTPSPEQQAESRPKRH